MKRRSTTLYCFSPPVMLATLLFELAAAAYVLWRYRLTTLTRLVVAMLLCLAAFQAAEYMICGGLGVQPGLWSKIGYSAITLLPPLGIHLGLTIAKKQQPLLLWGAYGTAIGFVTYFTFLTGSISGHTCYANYVVFSGVNALAALVYSGYYYGWLLVGVSLLFTLAAKAKNRHVSAALRWLGAGYLSFLLPTALVNMVDPSTISAVPSIMCGFAVILAALLTLKVVPATLHTENRPTLVGRLFRRS